MNKNKS